MALFDDTKTEISEKVIKVKEFKHVFPKIKGGDTNQRLEFDATQNV